MKILFVSETCRCSNCSKEYGQAYVLFGKHFCRNCLTSLAKLIYITVENFDKLGNKKEDKVLKQLEQVLETTKNMTTEEYLELFERCKGMKDIAYGDMVLLNLADKDEEG